MTRLVETQSFSNGGQAKAVKPNTENNRLVKIERKNINARHTNVHKRYLSTRGLPKLSSEGSRRRRDRGLDAENWNSGWKDYQTAEAREHMLFLSLERS